jgi:hypothetical protein
MGKLSVEIEIKPHHNYPETHSRVIVTTRNGFVFACDWAGKPELADAIQAWLDDRRSFRKYDTTNGEYL